MRKRGRSSPVGAEEDVARQLADGNHVGRLLQLDRLLVHEGALVVHDHVRIKRAVLGSTIGRRVAVGRGEVESQQASERLRRAGLRDSRATLAREGEAGEATLHLQVRDVSA